ncbi:DEAD/DEAH box helicase [Neoasaia chiangmaiensis]|uniref:DEAD/DEAH box helicase n=1 Tax=Neoasaia chiangmaiensis TaxID=320497 RepID=UPI00098AA070|nr:DEAD/DEAH box helicase [Neoasaia chiangmaiensis]
MKRGRGRPRKAAVAPEVVADVPPATKTAVKKTRRKTEAPSVENSPVNQKAATPAKKTAKSAATKPRQSKTKVAGAPPVPNAAVEAVASPEPATEVETTAVAAPKRRGRPRKATAAPEASASVKPTKKNIRPKPVPETEDVDAPVVASEHLEDTPSKDIETVEEKTDSVSLPPFSELGLSEPIMRAISSMGYERPTPIQAAAIPVVLSGRDVLGVAQTGTGKTASFTLPMLELLSGSRARARMPRSLILEPTRELALQVAENFKSYGQHLRLSHALLIGGESMADQRAVLNQGVDVLIATPGRLLDLFERGGLLLTQARLLVIDEADRMLDMGFIPDIERIVGFLPTDRQTLFFSATMAPEIRKLADAFLRTPEEITVARAASVAATIEEALLVVDEHDKRRTLRKLLRHEDVQNAIVFCNRKRDVDVLYKSLHKHHFAVGHLHGDLPQSVRSSTLERFKNGELKILVCSDVAARGIDISGLSHVFNFDLPFHAEDYVHRIGRTGRAGKLGHAYSLATPFQHNLLEAIEKLTHKTIAQPVIDGIETLPWADPDAEPPRRDHRRKNDRKHDKRRTRHDDARREDSRTETQAQHPEKPSRRAPAPVAPAAHFDHDAPATGFGSETPAFMLLPRRTPNRVSEPDRQGPVQHRGESA